MSKSKISPNTPINLDNKSNWKKINRIIWGKTIAQKMFRFYLIFVVVGSLFLWAPFSLKDPTNADHSFWDALFVGCSAFSDTGLTPVSIVDTYNIFGQVVIMLLIQIGGIGLITIIFFFWNLFKKWNSVDLKQVILLQAERGTSKIGNSYRAIKVAIIFVLITEIFFAILLSFCFCYIPAYEQVVNSTSTISYDSNNLIYTYDNYAMSLWCGLFTSVSSMNNAGIDIISSTSLAPYRNDLGLIIQVITLIEFVIGGLGFPVIFDYYEKIRHKRKGLNYKISLFSKICVVSYIVISILGLVCAYSFEYITALNNTNHLESIINCQNMNGEFGVNEWANKNWTIFYNTFSTRSAGYCTVDQQVLTSGTKISYIALMFIGASPSSTAGGIRTTTLVVMLAAVWCRLIGRKNVSLFKRNVSVNQINESYIIFFVALIFVVFSSVIVYYSIPNPDFQYSMIDCIYEVSSAFGTTGLSCNISPLVNPVGEIFIIMNMFIGQLGVSLTILSWTKRNPKRNNISYPEEVIKLG